MSSWPDVRVYLPVYTDVCVCLIDEEAHRVFGSRRRGRGATVEVTCRKAPGENADTAEPREEILSRQRARYCQRVTERRVTETATEREARRRVQDRARRASESLKQRDARLRSSQQQRIASESTEERPIFNNCGSVNSRGLLQPESTEEGEACLQQVRVGSRGLLKGLQT